MFFMKMLTVFIFLCSFFAFVSCQSCDNEFDKFYRCIDQSKQVKNEGSPYRKDNEKKNEIVKCFSSQNCKEPKFDNTNYPESKFKDAAEQQAEDDRKKRVECRQLIHIKVRESIEMCVQEKVPGFHLHNKTVAAYRPRYTMESIKSQVDYHCDDPNAKPAVNQCLDDVQQKHKQKTNKEEYEKKIRQSCQWRENCRPTMSSNCQIQYETAKPLVCDCARQKSKNDSESLAKQFDDCVGSAKLTLDDKPPMTSTLIGQDFEQKCDEILCMKSDKKDKQAAKKPNDTAEPKDRKVSKDSKPSNGELPRRKNVRNS